MFEAGKVGGEKKENQHQNLVYKVYTRIYMKNKMGGKKKYFTRTKKDILLSHDLGNKRTPIIHERNLYDAI